MTATDFLGSSSTVFAQILKQSEPSPQVQFIPPYVFTTRNKPIGIVGKAIYSSCDFGQNMLNFTWRLISGDDGFPLNVLATNIPQLFILPNTVSAGSTYVLGLRVSSQNDTARSSESVIILRIGYQALETRIDGGPNIQVSSQKELVLTSSSRDPDVDARATATSLYPLLFSWECFTLNNSYTEPCRDNNSMILAFTSHR